ncbi:thioredoxin family protein [Pontibacter sp. G13]|uniref:thioredoxin family protein n=1 Tax=Pontibacter sp. G13 TaxID=3074898 RepID=UPI00288A1B57|nr:thioredoxin family protein [Pontibacter sp. G13]WNJ20197.1 thioredoxin family protein [Pontibacter sp. G13]
MSQPTPSTRLLFFSGPNCGICQALKPKLTAALEEHFPTLPVDIIDVTQERSKAAQHLVFTLPVVIIEQAGKEAARFVSAFSVGEVLDRLRRVLGE